MADTLQPIIKKKKVVGGHGHHGGAWKVAYADFVTAMMAFFLLMWLLNATTEDQRKGIADYFNPTIPVSRISGGGSDALSGDSIYSEQTLARDGTGARQKENATKESGAKGQDNTNAGTDANLVSEKAAQLQAAIKNSNTTLSEHLLIKMSPEGLVIELVESDSRPLFAVGNARSSQLLQELLKIVAASFADVENNIKIVGHTDAKSFGPNAPYTNWELSTDRANTARRYLLKSGFPADQITEVSGKADTDPLSEDPFAPENRRISITILK
ncbi:MAG: OmpA family protein [Aquisalinus sp.]|nr:OmpA family protein [Aquisalinus sp.]